MVLGVGELIWPASDGARLMVQMSKIENEGLLLDLIESESPIKKEVLEESTL